MSSQGIGALPYVMYGELLKGSEATWAFGLEIRVIGSFNKRVDQGDMGSGAISAAYCLMGKLST